MIVNDFVENFINERIIGIFLLVLIISGNYLGELFPCRVQEILSESTIIKHIGGYLTLLFFVMLTFPEFGELDSLNDILIFFGGNGILYLWFIIMSKTYYVIWFIIFALAAIMYLIHLYQKNQKNEKLEHDQIEIVKKTLSYIIFILTLFGLLVYMGAKKDEYKDKFQYFKFFFGKPSCSGKSPPFPGYYNSFIKAFH